MNCLLTHLQLNVLHFIFTPTKLQHMLVSCPQCVSSQNVIAQVYGLIIYGCWAQYNLEVSVKDWRFHISCQLAASGIDKETGAIKYFLGIICTEERTKGYRCLWGYIIKFRILFRFFRMFTFWLWPPHIAYCGSLNGTCDTVLCAPNVRYCENLNCFFFFGLNHPC